jgi:agmatinase
MPQAFEQITWVKLAPGVGIESSDPQNAVLFHKQTSRRVRVPALLYKVMMQLQVPCSVQQLESEYPRITTALTAMLARGFLVDGLQQQQTAVRTFSAPPYTLFHTPKLNEATPDVTVIGVPFDLGSVVVSGQRRGPNELRLASNEFPYNISRQTNHPAGWFDIDSGRTILEGVTIADAGDFFFEYGEPQEAIYNRLGHAWLHLWKQGTLPLVIGGDHSITYPLIDQLQQQMDVVVLWFDAHTDESFLRSGQSHHYGNVVTRILDLPRVQRVIQIGTRGFTDARRALGDTDRLNTISAARLRTQGPTAVLDAIPRGLACYISLDLDVLDPSVAPAVGTPVAGGLLLHELEAAVEAVGLMHRVEGLDLVELNPDRAPGTATASAACRLLLKGLDSTMYRRLIPNASVGTYPIAAWQRT